MLIKNSPDAETKIAQIGNANAFELAGDQPHVEQKNRVSHQQTEQIVKADNRVPRYQARSLADCISNVSTPTGSKPILKTMLTTACERNCNYCPFRAGRSRTERVTITPEQLAGAFDNMQRAGMVDGLFLSSGIIRGSVSTQDKLLDTAAIIRQKYHYRGYIHLKIMPGAEYDQIYRSMQLADRISVNLEGATAERLNALAPKKDFTGELVQMLQWAAQIRRDHPRERLARSVTQFVVGAVGDTDVELLSTSEALYQHAGLTRAYYSAFHPVVQTPFENLPAVDLRREFRLYQSSFLLRDYGFSVEELPFIEAGSQVGNLRTDVDPKLAWAEMNLLDQPVEIMTADRERLLRVPGFGPNSVDAILAARAQRRLTDLSQLRALGIRAPERTAPFVLLDGHRPPMQARLFD